MNAERLHRTLSGFSSMTTIEKIRHIENQAVVERSRVKVSRRDVSGQLADVKDEILQKDLHAVRPGEYVELGGLRSEDLPRLVGVEELIQAPGDCTERQRLVGRVSHDDSPSIGTADVPPSAVSEPIVGDAPGAPASPAVDAPGAPSSERMP